VGSHQIVKFQGRIIAATNRDIGTMRQKGAFRNDFYYRLCSDTIEVPPLRQRLREDPMELQRLVEVTIDRILGEAAPDLLEMVMKTIARALPHDYHWPGNVRELEQCVRRIMIKKNYQGDSCCSNQTPLQQFLKGVSDQQLSCKNLLSLYCQALYDDLHSYEAVARITELDRRTAKKYIRGGW